MADYFVDGDDVLANKLGISDPQKLKEAEQDIVTKKTATLLSETPPTVFDFACLKHVHQILFEDVYNFAGQVRTVDMVKPDGGTPFAYARFIEPESKRIFDYLRRKNYLVDLNRQSFVREITNLATELNALHPFREGNGRAIRLFLILLANHAVYLLDYSQVSSKELINADKLAFEGDMQPLLAMYEKVVVDD